MAIRKTWHLASLCSRGCPPGSQHLGPGGLAQQAAHLSGSLRMPYTFCSVWNFSTALASPGFLSGCSANANLRKALRISSCRPRQRGAGEKIAQDVSNKIRPSHRAAGQPPPRGGEKQNGTQAVGLGPGQAAFGAAALAGTWLAARSTPSASYSVLPLRSTILADGQGPLEEQRRAGPRRSLKLRASG